MTKTNFRIELRKIGKLDTAIMNSKGVMIEDKYALMLIILNEDDSTNTEAVIATGRRSCAIFEGAERLINAGKKARNYDFKS